MNDRLRGAASSDSHNFFLRKIYSPDMRLRETQPGLRDIFCRIMVIVNGQNHQDLIHSFRMD